ncbi:MAG: MFS transporter [Rhodospirillaceae bacterium]|nr:MFS transporter [Rhodospirillaceae bacterium]
MTVLRQQLTCKGHFLPLKESMSFSSSKRNVLILSFCQVLFNSGRGLTFLAASLVAVNMLGGNLTLVTAPITMMLVGTAASTLPSALLMRRVGRKIGFVIGSVIGAIGGGICMYAIGENNFLLFNFGIFLFGIYSGSAQQYRFAAADSAPVDFKATAVSLVVAAGVVGAFVGPQSTLLTKDLFPAEYMGAFGALMCFTLLSGFVVLGIDIPKLSKQEYEEKGRPLGEIMAQPKFIVALIAAAFGYAVMNLLMTATPVTMKLGLFPTESTASVVQWHVVGMFAPGFITGNLINRYGAPAVILAGTLIFACAVIVALSGQTLAHFWTALFLLGIGWNFSFTGGTVMITEVHTPSERAKVQGTNDLLVFTMMAFSSLFSGTIYHFLGWAWVNYSTIPMIAIMFISVVWLVFRQRAERQIHAAE